MIFDVISAVKRRNFPARVLMEDKKPNSGYPVFEFCIRVYLSSSQTTRVVQPKSDLSYPESEIVRAKKSRSGLSLDDSSLSSRIRDQPEYLLGS